MMTTNWKEIAEFVGMAAIVASLLFVGLQLQQDRHLVRAELAVETFNGVAELQLAMSDYAAAGAFAKAFDRPQDLTTQEALQIDAYLQAFVSLLRREYFLVTIEVFVECKGIIRGTGPSLFSNDYAQSWWKRNRATLNLPDWVHSEISSIDVRAASQENAVEQVQ